MGLKEKLTPYNTLGLLFVVAMVFTFLIWLAGPLIQPWYDQLIPDQGAEWYYWKLPTRNDVGMLIVWALYLSHQFLIWGAIYWASKNLTEFKTTPSQSLTKFNYFVILVTIAFMAI
ncbi:MAG: hypothetical protein ACFFDR_07255, partial [Candidatus Thorarchaeota archaeon]